MGRLESIRDWACEYPGYEGLVKLNALVVMSGDGGIAAEGGETVTEEYIDGTEERSVSVVVRVAIPWSEGSDTLNPEAADLMEGWADWVADQWPGNPPDLDGAEVTEIAPVYTLPQIESVSESARTAVYSLTITFGIRS